MDRYDDTDWQDQIKQAARDMQYPPTPDAATAVLRRIKAAQTGQRVESLASKPSKRWLAPVLTLAVVIMFTLSLVPSVRAQIQEFLQIGPLRIFFTTPTASSNSPEMTITPPASLLELAGQTTLQDARDRWSHPLRMPAYPLELGDPDLVYLQGPNDEALLLVWLEPTAPSQVYLALQALAPGEMLYTKTAPESVQETRVNEDEAYWIVGMHLLQMKNGTFDLVRLVEGHVLAWSDGELTYRLESNLSMDEAVKIAESMR